MKNRSFTLCPACEACPEVTFHDDGTVSIGESPNLATLEREEWNELVRLIRSGVAEEVRA